MNWPAIISIVIGLSLFAAAWAYLPVLWGAPWVPSSSRTVYKMLQMAKVQPGQKVVDLGAGDGRIVILAAKMFKAHAVGVEIDPLRCLIANGLIRVQGLQGTAHVYCGNMYEFDMTDANVVTVYLLQGTNQRLKLHLEQCLPVGAKVVSHSFSMDGWTPRMLDDDQHIFLYEIGHNGADVRTEFV